MGVYVCQTFESRLQVNPIESPHFCLISVFVSTCRCLSFCEKIVIGALSYVGR